MLGYLIYGSALLFMLCATLAPLFIEGDDQ
jgi:hypothetical protein